MRLVARVPYPAPVTISPPPPPAGPAYPPLPSAGPTYPEWDPMPRPPRYIAAWLALALVGGGGIAAVVSAGSVFSSRYAVRADVCSAVDLGPVGAALGRPDVSATDVSDPDDVGGSTALQERRCQFTVTLPDGGPRAGGTVTATWYDNALMGKFFYETRYEQAGEARQSTAEPAELTGLGDRAFTHQQADDGIVQFRVATLDSNLMLDLRVVAGVGDPAWGAGHAEAARAALTDALRASLPRLR